MSHADVHRWLPVGAPCGELPSLLREGDVRLTSEGVRYIGKQTGMRVLPKAIWRYSGTAIWLDVSTEKVTSVGSAVASHLSQAETYDTTDAVTYSVMDIRAASSNICPVRPDRVHCRCIQQPLIRYVGLDRRPVIQEKYSELYGSLYINTVPASQPDVWR